MTSNRVADLSLEQPLLKGWFESLNLIPYAQASDGQVFTVTMPAALEKELGLTVDDLMRGVENWYSLIHPADRVWVEELVRQAHLCQTGLQCEYRIVAPSGKIFWFMEIGTTRAEPNGSKTILSGLRIDITQWKGTESQALHSRRIEANGLMASRIAHEFNNLLTLICSYTTFASESLSDHPAQADLLQVQKAAERAVSFTKRLLSLSPKRIVVGENCDLQVFFQTYSGTLRQLVGSEIHLNVECDSSLPSVQILPAQLEQLVVILISNSREALVDGGRVDIWAGYPDPSALHPLLEAKPDSFVCLKIVDNGPGLSDEVRSHLFEPFYSTKTPKGRGLGLATAHGIVKRHGGHIEASNIAGGGVEFRIFLPVAKPVAPAPSVSPVSVQWEKDHHAAPAALRDSR